MYEHTQYGRFPLLIGMLLLLPSLIALVASDFDVAVLVPIVISVVLIMAVVWAASALRVAVTAEEVRLAFRYGWPRKVIRRSDIVGAEAVRNRWWYGFGIRWLPRGWMWNVWGLDAVQVSMADGGMFRIGTDDPGGLIAALTR